MVDVLRVGRGTLAEADGARGIDEARLAADMARVQPRVGALCEAIVEWKHVVLGRFSHEPILQLAQLRWLLGREIVSLREVLVDVVKLPAVLIEARAAGGEPWQPA